METASNKKRDSNFELLRIVAMLMIISLHYIEENHMMDRHGNMTASNIIFLLIYIATLVCTNVFVLITGYHLIHSQFKIQKIIRLWGLALFYSYGVYLFYRITNPSILNQVTIYVKMRTFAPILNVNYWFLVPYLGLYMIFPFLNKMIKGFQQKQLKVILIIFFILLSVLHSATTFLDLFEASGHGFIWFIFLYAVGAYIRLYGKQEKQKGAEKYKYLAIFFISFLLTFVMKIGLEILQGISVTAAFLNKRLLNFNSVLAVVETVSLFLFFKNITIHHRAINQMITAISSNVLAVYLLHSHHISQVAIWRKTNLNLQNCRYAKLFSSLCDEYSCYLYYLYCNRANT